MRVIGNCLRTENTRSPQNGFTLIEIIVVMAIISTVIFLSIPRIQNELFVDQTKKVSRWIYVKVRHLKEISLRERKDYILHVDLATNSFSISQQLPEEEEGEERKEDNPQKGHDPYELPQDVRILDVEFPDNQIFSAGRIDILFYAKGYSDKALIHLEDEKDRRISFLIEPFLPTVKYFDRHVGFDD
jgi:prepilin-type N-terminal cleavage/methylation domain-containing protein